MKNEVYNIVKTISGKGLKLHVPSKDYFTRGKSLKRAIKDIKERDNSLIKQKYVEKLANLHRLNTLSIFSKKDEKYYNVKDIVSNGLGNKVKETLCKLNKNKIDFIDFKNDELVYLTYNIDDFAKEYIGIKDKRYFVDIINGIKYLIKYRIVNKKIHGVNINNVVEFEYVINLKNFNLIKIDKKDNITLNINNKFKRFNLKTLYLKH